jgi:hypothetical protein
MALLHFPVCSCCVVCVFECVLCACVVAPLAFSRRRLPPKTPVHSDEHAASTTCNTHTETICTRSLSSAEYSAVIFVLTYTCMVEIDLLKCE